MTKTAAYVLAATLDKHGVDVAYCVPGESYLPLTDALIDFPNIQLVVCRHEGGAGFMAAAHARLRNEVGVCVISRGPGAMNTAIALHVAYHDAEPVVFLVGQAEMDELGRNALQEMNYSKTFSDTAKMVIEVIDPSRIAESVARAFHVAQAGTPGPVVVVLPEDILYGPSDAEPLGPRKKAVTGPSAADKAQALEMLRSAQKPLVVAGGRLHGAQALGDFTKFAEEFQLPVATSQRRFHVFDSRHPNAAGRLFNRAPGEMLEAMKESDLLLVLGERIGPSMSQGYTFPRAPKPDQPMIHVWPSTEEVGRNYEPELGIGCDPHEFIKAMMAKGAGDLPAGRAEWVQRLNTVHKEVMNWTPVSSNDGVVFGHVITAIDKHMEKDAVVTCDAGNFSSWPSRFLNMGQENMFIGATVGAMGPGVPSGVAAGLSTPGRQIVVFVGDGGAMMTGNELATAIQYGVPIKIFVSNNNAYGTIRMHQAKAFPGRVTSTELVNPDFAAWGEAFGARGFKIETEAEVDEVVAEAMAHDGPCVIETRVSLNHISPSARIDEIEAR
ncbi:MAG: thiamine pyrophosphate-dependent enzyme [Pseudomonadota bacterium]|nr:thiamine pyrophosphate-dependent enzyme [Pseudomonadota bacterium]